MRKELDNFYKTVTCTNMPFKSEVNGYKYFNKERFSFVNNAHCLKCSIFLIRKNNEDNASVTIEVSTFKSHGNVRILYMDAIFIYCIKDKKFTKCSLNKTSLNVFKSVEYAKQILTQLKCEELNEALRNELKRLTL